MRIGGIDWGPKPLKIFNCWLKETSLQNLPKDYWDSALQKDKNLQLTLKEVKNVIKGWSKDFRDSMESKN